MTDSLSEQIGGQHYKGLLIQPITLSMANRYDACIHSSIKYVTRHGDKGGAEDLKKAAHFCALRIDSLARHDIPFFQPASPRLAVERYLELNAIPEEEGFVIVELHRWAIGDLITNGADLEAHRLVAYRLIREIEYLSDMRYPPKGKQT
jgi:hypothetical protein